jgi:hypothetical protein
MKLIHGMDIATAHRYLEVMECINQHTEELLALADFMTIFEDLDLSPGENKLNPCSIGCYGRMISSRIIKIAVSLEEFSCPESVKLELEELETRA